MMSGVSTGGVGGIPGLPGATAVPVAVAGAVEVVRPLREAKLADKHGWWWGTGRRKSAVARVRMKPASGDAAAITFECKSGKVKTVEEYFTEERDRNECVAALKTSGLVGKFRIVCSCHGGGYMGQAASVKLGIARAICDYDPTLELGLRQAGMLTRDARKVERKKYGQAGARKRFQFSKR